MVARPVPYELKVIWAVGDPDVRGIKVVSEKLAPPWKLTTSPGWRAALLTRETDLHGAAVDVPAFESEPTGLT
jgi:hypothetical protein